MRGMTAGLAALALVVLMAAPVGAAPKPNVQVTPNTGIASIQRVKVIGRHLAVGRFVMVTQCDGEFPQHGVDDCAYSDGGLYMRKSTDSAGYVKVKIKAMSGPIGTNGQSCGTSSADNNCVMAVMVLGPNQVPDPSTAVTGPISFALPR